MTDLRYIPQLITADSFQEAWAEAVLTVDNRPGKTARNLMVQIGDPLALKPELHAMYRLYTQEAGVRPEHLVARAIFPDDLAAAPSSLGTNFRDPEELADLYHAPGGYFEQGGRTKPRSYGRWGTYFGRITNHHGVNVLADLIRVMKSRHYVMKAAYSMYTALPSELSQNRGMPCLQYLTWQLEPEAVGLFALYRNHSFTEMAYGNYHALGQLMEYVRDQAGWDTLGPLTVLSSHAYLDKQPTLTRNLAASFRSVFTEEQPHGK